jgi:hypothetical protein
MRDKLVFLGKFLVFSAFLSILWMPLSETYVLAAAHTAKALISLFGGERTINIPVILAMPEAGKFSSIVPFTALVLATPRLGPGERARMVLAGVLIIFSSYVLLLAAIPGAVEGSWTATTLHRFLNESGKIGIPVLLWFFLVNRRFGLIKYKSLKLQ